MKARINGEEVLLSSEVSLAAVIAARKINPQAVVVEYNGVILTREKFDSVVLKENDTLEIVAFVGADKDGNSAYYRGTADPQQIFPGDRQIRLL